MKTENSQTKYLLRFPKSPTILNKDNLTIHKTNPNLNKSLL